MGDESIRQICKSLVIAMGMLHAKGLVHLDMKPENIMRARGCTFYLPNP